MTVVLWIMVLVHAVNCQVLTHSNSLQVKLLLGMLVTKCGQGAVKDVIPEEHMKLLTNIRKIQERKERKWGAKSEETKSHFSKATKSGSNIRPKKNLSEHLSDESDDEPLDLLDRRKTWSALRSSEHLKKIKRKEKPAEPEYDARSKPYSHLSGKSGTKAQKRRKTSDSGWAYTGKEYASKKARGDVKRKDKLEPYAYWPLDRKMMSRRPQQRAAARKGMSSVVKMTKRYEGKSASGVLSMKSLKLKKKGSKKKM
ncbi:hypothetical protein Ahy_B02g061443 isoform A [Arachis hypogaea]|uniref:RRP12-like protein n=2 Tax=Arachis hypogaea TaxID=3818 RepID=A0A445AKY3_ARAHY|nr:hypothetical protein Ahy_B02g061443 isoform A [Arachis hypogaea]